MLTNSTYRGSPLLSRVITYQPERLLAVAFLDIGYWAPGTNLNESTINAINNATQATVGYTAFGYWLFHNENDAGSIMDAHVSIKHCYSGFSSSDLQGVPVGLSIHSCLYVQQHVLERGLGAYWQIQTMASRR